MEKQDIIKVLNEMADNRRDHEIDHSEADRMIADFLFEQGHGDLSQAYNEARVYFWYT